jgi:hypothetical protein
MQSMVAYQTSTWTECLCRIRRRATSITLDWAFIMSYPQALWMGWRSTSAQIRRSSTRMHVELSSFGLAATDPGFPEVPGPSSPGRRVDGCRGAVPKGTTASLPFEHIRSCRTRTTSDEQGGMYHPPIASVSPPRVGAGSLGRQTSRRTAPRRSAFAIHIATNGEIIWRSASASPAVTAK